MEKVKKYIFSLLTSSPVVISMDQLNKDYENFIGEPIPYHRLGFSSLESFLKAIPDTVLVRNYGGMVEVLPLQSEKSAHVDALVRSQKIPKKKSNVYTSPPKKKYIYYPNTTGNHLQMVYPSSGSKAVKNYENTVSNSSDRCEGEDLLQKPHLRTVSNDLNDHLKIKNDSGMINESDILNSRNMTINNKSGKGDNHANEHRELNKGVISRSHNLSNRHMSLDDYSSRPVDNYANESSQLNNTKYSGKTTNTISLLSKIQQNAQSIDAYVPLQIIDNLKTLIALYPNGISCTDLYRVYRLTFNTNLNVHELGYSSLIHLCTSLPSVFNYSPSFHGDIILYDKNKSLPTSIERSNQNTSLLTSVEHTPSICNYNITSNMADEVCGVPALDWCDMYHFLPENIIKKGYNIPSVFVSLTIKEEDILKIVLGEIYDPSKFWVYIDDGQLDRLMDSMQNFYKANASEYIMPESLIENGVYCVQIIYGEYHRAVIVDVLPELQDMVKVFFIDYGTTAKVSTKGLCYLHEKYSILPAQAIRCRLADIYPPIEGSAWSREASSTFRSMIRHAEIDAKIVRVNYMDQILETQLINVTNPKRLFCINAKLVDKNLAYYTEQKQKKSKVSSAFTPIVKYLHLFPTFIELEYGCVPSAQEMDVLHSCNVPINFCYPQYFTTDTNKEKQNIKETVDFYEKNLMNKKISNSHYVDITCVAPKTLDLSIFGDLEDEIMNFIGGNQEEHHVEDEQKPVDNIYICKEKDTAQRFHKDTDLSEDIMRKLEILNYSSQGSVNEDLYIESIETCIDNLEINTKDEITIGPTIDTNPFHNISQQEADAAAALGVNPNNPFLPYLLGKANPGQENSTSNCSNYNV